MGELAKKKATYEDLYKIPDNLTGEIIDGDLIVTPQSGKWVLLGSFAENDKVRANPFLEIEIDLEALWLGSLRSPGP